MGSALFRAIPRLGTSTAKSNGTDYLSETDGIICGYMRRVDANPMTVNIYSDGSTPPTMIIQKAESVIENTAIPFCVPVKKGQYYRVDFSGTLTDYAYLWIPIINT